MNLKVGIFGISGSAGEKLTEILVSHPSVEITAGYVAPDEDSKNIDKIIPRLKDVINLECKNKVDWEYVKKNCDLVFLALPHSVSMEYVPQLRNMEKKVIDLSADFRFKDIEIYEKYYKKHSCPQFIKEAVYGLPELYREEIKNASLIGNPGCYPTSIILATAPLVKNGIVEEEIIANSVSGVTGAGKKPSESNIFIKCNENIKAYKIGEHRHQPEIEEILSNEGKRKHKVLFVPHLAPYDQGILSTVYLKAKKEIKKNEIVELYNEFYKNEPFVRIMEYGISPSVKDVRDTNFCDIGFKIVDDYIVVMSAIDNLVKGASGQAVQNMNLMYGFNETIPFI